MMSLMSLMNEDDDDIENNVKYKYLSLQCTEVCYSIFLCIYYEKKWKKIKCLIK